MTAIFRRIHWFHPEWFALTVAAVAWLAMLAPAATVPAHLVGAPGHGSNAAAPHHIALMATAMMTPLALAHVEFVATSSLWRRRYRAVAAFLVGFLGCWTLAGGVLTIGAIVLTELVGPTAAVVMLFAGAALAQLASRRRRLLRQCQATRPLAIRGARADLDSIAYGFASGRRCVATCWQLMAAVAASPGLIVMAAASALQIGERRWRRPNALAIAALVAIIGVVAALMVGAGQPPASHHAH